MQNIDLVFRILGETVVPAELTKHLSLEPSAAHAKGDAVEHHPTRVRSSGFWSIKSTLAPTASLEDHVKFLLDVLERRHNALLELQQRGLFMSFFAGLFSEGAQQTTARFDPGVARCDPCSKRLRLFRAVLARALASNRSSRPLSTLSPTDTGSFIKLSPETLLRIGRLGAPLEIHFYNDGD